MIARLTGIDPAQVRRHLGYPAGIESDVSQACAQVLAEARPRIVWRRLPRTKENEALIAGEDLRQLLKDATELVLFAATLGAEMDALLRRVQVRDMAQAVVLDACADSAIETVCDNFCMDLAEAVAPFYLTDRFSPGYGDLPLAHQRVLFDTLDITRRIGITLTDSGLMNPQKSVTAILGISAIPQPRRGLDCKNCKLFSYCTHRKGEMACENG